MARWSLRLSSLACAGLTSMAAPAWAADGPDDDAFAAGFVLIGAQVLVATGGTVTAVGSLVTLATEPSTGWAISSFVLGGSNLVMGGVVLGLAADTGYGLGTGVGHIGIGLLNVGLGLGNLLVESDAAPDVGISTIIDVAGYETPLLTVRAPF